MVGTVLRAFAVFALVVAITGVIGLFIMAGVAGQHGVVPIPVPSESYLASLQADNTSAFRVPLEYNTYGSIDRVAEEAFHLGAREIYRSEEEVVYEGYRAGIRYFISYMLDRNTIPQTLTIVTLVRVHGTKSGYVWRVARPVHTRIAPYLLDRMAQAAPD